jgi:hypothetical protein
VNRRLRTLSATAALLAAAAGGLTLSSTAGASTHNGKGGDALAAVRAATAKYHRVDAAIAAGYRPSEGCAASPEGAMGRHYLNPALMGSIDPARPAILLYVPTENGLRLAGVEWFQADADQDLATDGDRPSLFGQPFDGPMPGHEPGMPAHYDLHAWVWADNPSGVFAPWNPSLSC